ncbi:MAG: non-canonical purine NTP pyrophosphatase [Firmicutes bacterium]|nr:non-canonical purine NTP pyrophosphatase [Bacillota bacterium]
MKEITYVTGNWAKVASAKQILEPLGFKINNVKMDTIEIQADNMEEVAKFSAKYASEKLKTNVLKNDSGLVIPALNGFPGPYTHYVDDTLGEDGILKLMEGIEDRYAYFVEALAYCELGKEPIVIVAKTEGTIDTKKSGEYGWSWDFIFIPKGQTKTMANFKDEDRWNLWDNTAYLKLAEYLNNEEKH